jgi:hypothetical protein
MEWRTQFASCCPNDPERRLLEAPSRQPASLPRKEFGFVLSRPNRGRKQRITDTMRVRASQRSFSARREGGLADLIELRTDLDVLADPLHRPTSAAD